MKLGVHITMDDFGTGYLSLSYLPSFPFERIKIDRSFIRDVTERAGSRNIVRAVVALATGWACKQPRRASIQEQLDAIRSEGCAEMQGFLFSKPLPAHEIERLFLSKQMERKISGHLSAANSCDPSVA